ncbi:MAG: hypothetical protein DRJ42_16200 [Deltaproteobacteria bacterium]|nr:MAG: hypothetical protein DRJ42_16200 [Deltaproteobacteria bacterium]
MSISTKVVANGMALVVGALGLAGLAACDGCGGAPVTVDSSPGHREPPVPEPREVVAEGPTIEPFIETVTEAGGERYELSRFRFVLSETKLRAVDLAFEETLRGALEAETARLVINGGYWDTAMHPEGLTRVGAEELAPFSRSLGGGILVVSGGVGRLLDAEDSDLDVPTDLDFAQQCMPRIVVDGALNIGSDNGRRADRTALCLRDGGRVLDVYVARGDDPAGHGGPTLYTFGEQLVSRGCEAALNLDGGGSTGAAWREEGGVRALPPRVALRLALVFE